ncbi:hydantoinase/oxoprolinase family protein [Salipiger mucosus]|uniref:N-methylhydantoinase A n=1 Tax=Salipiger mucosus DSM 16094 TaxID=1123237 RepID=S9RPB4_9RHOB|nr:hydantoinase/oxoprolinase family protein [Salipiger mucosus]EPX75869.1 N-methylhydantoinase A [Salipiger mucosus DSM 16094]
MAPLIAHHVAKNWSGDLNANDSNGPVDSVDTPRFRIGVDSGGTFTDVCVFDREAAEVFVWKVSSTPSDPSEGIVDGIRQSIDEVGKGVEVDRDDIYFGHGTTVGTNALLTGRGADTGMITTAGFRDVIEIRRQKRPELYNLQTEKPPVLASRDKRFEVTERILYDGTIMTDLDEESVRVAARQLKAEGVHAIAVCTLFSFIEPKHEKRIRDIVVEEYPEAFVSTSHEAAPEFREFERFTTTVVNAYLGPIMRSYLDRLVPRLEEIGISVKPHLTQSNGGVISCESAKEHPVRTVLSGPAAGVMAAQAVGRAISIGNLITFDMGGTSSDVSLIENGTPKLANHTDVHGYPLKVPMLDIHTVGAGGGSIAAVDNGILKVGPRSAGAAPGPVCYGLGNDEPTVTDANVVLGILNQEHFLDGRMPIDSQASHAAVERLAESLGIGKMEAAQGIIRVVIANMAKAIRVISVERGYDPRDYAMLAFGGAGPVHAARLAAELDIKRVIVPKNPGVMCALGLLQSDLRTDLSITRLSALSTETFAEIEAGFEQLDARAEEWCRMEEIPEDSRRTKRTIDLRYGGQGYEITVDWPEATGRDALVAGLRANFEAAHEQLYGYISSEEPIHVTTLRLEAVGHVPKAELKQYPMAAEGEVPVKVADRNVYFPEFDDFRTVPLYDRTTLRPDQTVPGPAIVEQMDSTTLILPDQAATVDPYLNLIIESTT